MAFVISKHGQKDDKAIIREEAELLLKQVTLMSIHPEVVLALLDEIDDLRYLVHLQKIVLKAQTPSYSP